jgi:hypothetical protein
MFPLPFDDSQGSRTTLPTLARSSTYLRAATLHHVHEVGIGGLDGDPNLAVARV